MDAYIEIAATVLRSERRPLSPRAILAAAYRNGLVPSHLHGKTQHKTLQARLSEDIISRREHSKFFRTAPGRFFLREYLADDSVPEEYRQPVPTRRRIRELIRAPALAFNFKDLRKIASANTPIQSDKVLDLLKSESYSYEDPRCGDENYIFLRSFVCVRRNNEVLSYRLGRYRDDRDSFMSRRSIGFAAYVDVHERTLFSLDDFGIVDSGVRATKIDLDIPDVPESKNGSHGEARLRYFIWVHHAPRENDLLAVVTFECPTWFEPLKRRLALNDVAWMDFERPVNNVDDFDPWSRAVLEDHYRNERQCLT